MVTLGSLLGACSAVDTPMERELAGLPDVDRAYIVGSFTVECQARGEDCITGFFTLKTMYRSVGGDKLLGEIGYYTSAFKRYNTIPDFVNLEDGKKGVYFCQPVRAGSYSLYNYYYWRYEVSDISYTLREKDEFNIPFRVNAGEMLYVGDIKLTESTETSLLGKTMPAPGLVVLSPGNEQEKRFALAKCPENVQQLPIVMNPLRASGGGHPAVRDADEN